MEVFFLRYLEKGPSIKDVRSQGGGSLSSAKILRTRGEGVLQMRKFALFCAKTFVFFEIYGASARIRVGGRSLPSADIFRTRGRRSIFCNFLWMSFMDGHKRQHGSASFFSFFLSRFRVKHLFITTCLETHCN